MIVRHIKNNYNLMIGDRTAETIKINIGSAFHLEQEMSMEVRGRDMVAGLPKTVMVTSDEIREALSEPVAQIVERVKRVLEQTPPELSSDIIERGITLTGGGALLRGFDRLLALATGIRSMSPTTRCPVSRWGPARRWKNFRRFAPAKISSRLTFEY